MPAHFLHLTQNKIFFHIIKTYFFVLHATFIKLYFESKDRKNVETALKQNIERVNQTLCI